MEINNNDGGVPVVSKETLAARGGTHQGDIGRSKLNEEVKPGNLMPGYNPFNAYNAGYSDMGLEATRYHNQSNWNRFGYVAANFIPNFLIGIGEGVGSLGYIFTGFDNDYAKGMRGLTALRNPFTSDDFMLNYKTPGRAYDMSDPTTYFSMGSSLVESIASFAVVGATMAPIAEGVGKAASWGLTKGANALYEGEQLVNAGRNILNASKYITQGTQAGLMSYSEGAGIGQQVYDAGLKAYSQDATNRIYATKIQQAKAQYGEDLPETFVKQLYTEANKEALVETERKYGSELAKAAWSTTGLNTLLGTALNWTSAGLFLKKGQSLGQRAFNEIDDAGNTVKTNLRNAIGDIRDPKAAMARLSKLTPEIARQYAFKNYLVEGLQEFAEEASINNTAQWYGEKQLGLNKESWGEMQFSAKSFIDGTLGFIGGFGQTAGTNLSTKYMDGRRTDGTTDLGYMSRDKYNAYLENGAVKSQLMHLGNDLTKIDEILTTTSNLREQRDAAKSVTERNRLNSLIDSKMDEFFTLSKYNSIRNGNGDLLTNFYQEVADTDNTKIIGTDINGNPETQAMHMGYAESPNDNAYKQRANQAISDIEASQSRWLDYQRKYNLDGYDVTNYADTVLGYDLLQQDFKNSSAKLTSEINDATNELTNVLTHQKQEHLRMLTIEQNKILSLEAELANHTALLAAVEADKIAKLKVLDSKPESDEVNKQKSEVLANYTLKSTQLTDNINKVQTSISEAKNNHSDVLNTTLLSDKSYSDLETQNIELGANNIADGELIKQERDKGKTKEGDYTADVETAKQIKENVAKFEARIKERNLKIEANKKQQAVIKTNTIAQVDAIHKSLKPLLDSIKQNQALHGVINKSIENLQKQITHLLSEEGRNEYRQNWQAYIDHVEGLYNQYVKDEPKNNNTTDTTPPKPKDVATPPPPKPTNTPTTEEVNTTDVNPVVVESEQSNVVVPLLEKMLLEVEARRKKDNAKVGDSIKYIRQIADELNTATFKRDGEDVTSTLQEHVEWAVKILNDLDEKELIKTITTNIKDGIVDINIYDKQVQEAIHILNNFIKAYAKNINNVLNLKLKDSYAIIITDITNAFNELLNSGDFSNSLYDTTAEVLGLNTNMAGHTVLTALTAFIKDANYNTLRDKLVMTNVYLDTAFTGQYVALTELVNTVSRFNTQRNAYETNKDITATTSEAEDTTTDTINTVDNVDTKVKDQVIGIFNSYPVDDVETFLLKPYEFYTYNYKNDSDFVKFNGTITDASSVARINAMLTSDNDVEFRNALLAKILKDNGFTFAHLESKETNTDFMEGSTDMNTVLQASETNGIIPLHAKDSFNAMRELKIGDELIVKSTKDNKDVQQLAENTKYGKPIGDNDIAYYNKDGVLLGTSASDEHTLSILTIAEQLSKILGVDDELVLQSIRKYLNDLGKNAKSIIDVNTIAETLLRNGTINIDSKTIQVFDEAALDVLYKYYNVNESADARKVLEHIQRVLNFKKDITSPTPIRDNLTNWVKRLQNDIKVITTLKEQLKQSNEVKVVVTGITNGEVITDKVERKLNEVSTIPQFEQIATSEVGFVFFGKNGWQYAFKPADSKKDDIRKCYADMLPNTAPTSIPRLVVNNPINKHAEHGKLIALQLNLHKLNAESIKHTKVILQQLLIHINNELVSGKTLKLIMSSKEVKELKAKLNGYINEAYGKTFTNEFKTIQQTDGKVLTVIELIPDVKQLTDGKPTKYSFTLGTKDNKPEWITINSKLDIDAVLAKFKRNINYRLASTNKAYYESLFNTSDITTNTVPLIMDDKVVAITHTNTSKPFKIYSKPLDSNNLNTQTTWQKQLANQSQNEANANQAVDDGVNVENDGANDNTNQASSSLSPTGEISRDTANDTANDTNNSIINQVIDYIKDKNTISVPEIQREFKLSYNDASAIIETLEEQGKIGAFVSNNVPRVVIQLNKSSIDNTMLAKAFADYGDDVDLSIIPILNVLNSNGISTYTSHSSITSDHNNRKSGAAYLYITPNIETSTIKRLQDNGFTLDGDNLEDSGGMVMTVTFPEDLSDTQLQYAWNKLTNILLNNKETIDYFNSTTSNTIPDIDFGDEVDEDINDIQNQEIASIQTFDVELNNKLQDVLSKLYPEIKVMYSDSTNANVLGQADIKAKTVLINAILQGQDTLPHEYAHHYIAMFRDSDIVKEAVAKWGSEEALVQAIGEQVVKQKGEAYNWLIKFIKWITSKFDNISNLDKEELKNILTDSFLTNTDLNKFNSNSVQYMLKAVDILNSDKAKQLFNKAGTNKWNIDKLLQELTIPKEQKQLIIDIANTYADKTIYDLREQIILDLASKYSYSVEVNISKNANQQLTNEQAEGLAVYHGITDDKNKGENTAYYSNLTVPGGTNYTENEISTPLITPNIKGHARFSTDNGIGWFRSDEQLIQSKSTSVSYVKDIPVKQFITSPQDGLKNLTLERGKWGYNKDYSPTAERIIVSNEDIVKYWNNSEGNKTKSNTGLKVNNRRVLELQSDLFQKGRDKTQLVNKEFNPQDWFIEEDFSNYNITDSVTGQPIKTFTNREDAQNFITKYKTNDKENQFLQLLNKDNNWVTFFIKAIIQDSIKKGYEKVLFPKGETAAKIEGHQTIANDIISIDKKIESLKLIKNSDIRESGGYVGVFTNEYGVEEYDIYETEEDAKKTYDKRIKELEQRKSELKSQGIEKLKPIEAFYEIKVGNILEKQFGKNNVKTITDEYGNEWREITLPIDNRILLQTASIQQQLDTLSLYIKSNNELTISNTNSDKVAQVQSVLDNAIPGAKLQRISFTEHHGKIDTHYIITKANGVRLTFAEANTVNLQQDFTQDELDEHNKHCNKK